MLNNNLFQILNFFAFLLFQSVALSDNVTAQDTFTFQDVMQFEDIRSPVISANGEWVAFGVWPELGDGEVRIKSVNGSVQYTIKRGENPQLSANGAWAGAIIKPPYIKAENADNDSLKDGLKLLNISTGETRQFENVQRFEFSNDGRWVIIRYHQQEMVEKGDFDNPHIGTPLKLMQLESGNSQYIPFVNEAAVDSSSNYFVYATVDTTGNENSIFAIDLSEDHTEHKKVLGAEQAYYTNLTWDHKNARIAMNATHLDTASSYRPHDASVVVWEAFGGEPETWILPEDVEEGYRLRSHNNLTWSHDGGRLFYGVKAAEMVALDEQETEPDSLTAENLFDPERILADVEGKVWHWDDPLVKTHEKQTWNTRKDHLFTAVYHIEEERSVQLATTDIPDLNVSDNSNYVLASSELPYQKLITWDGRYRDFYLVDLGSGQAEQFLEKHRFGVSLSPNGLFAAWFDGTDWQIKSTETGKIRNLTKDLDVPFANEDNDRPMPSPSYGIAGWTDNDDAVLIYDKYDIWQFDTSNGEYLNLTAGQGRSEQRIFRVHDLNPDKETFAHDEHLLVTMYHDWDKNYGYYEGKIGREGVNRVLEDDKRFTISALAGDDDAILFRQETYTEYPNLWLATDHRFRNPVQISNLHEDLTDRFAWGHAELVEWLNMDGRTVQGILYYPGDYDPEKRYPVFIYYYERFSQRLHEFNIPVTNHRPNIVQYTSDGYAVFLPDIWFDVPIPGYSATKNLVPGVKKLVEMGVADPDAIGLHGHSWSGYLTAQVVTQTDIFAAAIAGAPVGNMTSAYSGIRWGTGLARQFQYEQTQSRLGVSMWENLAPYIENSPVFFADRINTPLMIQHGDADEAVPWYQSIELYLALRRLGKESVFLHYYDEPHHLRQFANRLDYAIKMKEYMDHYLKGKPAPSWITDGVPYEE
jgi:dipeptidyl aminopeptidase/acylaminoacyl peptidase